MRNLELKIKIRSLAEEARIIRAYEHKLIKQARNCHRKELLEEEATTRRLFSNIHAHRTIIIRDEARASQLVAAFAKGKYSYKEIEPFSRTDPKWDKADAILARFTSFAEKNEAARLFREWSGRLRKAEEMSNEMDSTR